MTNANNDVKTLLATRTAARSDKETKEAVRALLRELGSHTQGEETIQWEGTRFVLPASMKGDLGAVIRQLDEIRRAEETKEEFSRTFKYRRFDGAVAFSRAMSDIFGVQGIGKVTRTMFGDIDPQIMSVEIGIDEHVQAPWGKVGLSALEAEFTVGYAVDEELGYVSRITCKAPRKYKMEIQGFFDMVGDHLRNNSIYRGKAITGASTPGFFNAYSVRPDGVIYTDSVMKQLSANVWAPIRNAQKLRDMGRSLKRTVLLEGRYGTGKSLAGVLTAQVAVENGWTFIIVRSGDDPLEALRTAKMYAPAVVFIEDFDLLTAGKTREEIDRVLDAMDSVSTKGQEVMGVLTTNFLEDIDQAALRPGRIDHIVHFGGLEEDGYTRLVKSIIPAAQLAADVNFETVARAMDGMFPAFAAEVANKSVMYSLDRAEGASDVITTQDLLDATEGMREQLAVMQRAAEAKREHPGMDQVFKAAMAETLNRTYDDGDTFRVRDSV